MKIFTKRLWQFAGCTLITSAIFQLVTINAKENAVYIIAAIVYFGLMYLIGWYFGKKDCIENNIYDIGIRWHVTTYLICNGLSLLFWYLFISNDANLSVTINRVIISWGMIIWGIFVVVHFIVFLMTRKNAIKGYNKEELFE